MAYINKEIIRAKKIEIYQRKEKNVNPNIWYAHLKVDDNTRRISLNTIDIEDAEEKALDAWQEMKHKLAHGYSLKTMPFRLVANKYLEYYQSQVSIKENLPARDRKKLKVSANVLKSHTDMINNFIIPILGDKNITAITDDDIKDYIKLRENWWVTGIGSKQEYIQLPNGRTRTKRDNELGLPNYNTVNRTLSAIRAIFKYAKDNKLINRHEIPEICNVSKPDDNDKDNLTPSFTDDEMNIFHTTLSDKVNNQKNPKHRRSSFRFAMYVAIMSMTGMRSSDTRNLKISDCYPDKMPPYIFVNSKNNRRQVIPSQGEFWTFINSLIAHHKKNAIDFGWAYSDDMNLFSNDYGKPIGSYIGQLSRVLDSCGLRYFIDDEGISHTRNTKSFRPYYITNALKGGIAIEDIARNVGNSVNVIRQHYDRMVTTDSASKLQFHDGNFSENEPLNLGIKTTPSIITKPNTNSLLYKLTKDEEK
jgi:integrase